MPGAPPPPPVPIDGVPQFDSYEFQGTLYAKIVHIVAPAPIYVGLDPKGGVALPLPPATPVVQVPSPGFGLILLIALGLGAGIIAGLVAAGVMTQEEADETQGQIDEALADPSKFTNPQGLEAERRGFSTTGRRYGYGYGYPGRRRPPPPSPVPVTTEDIIVDEPVEDPERQRVRVGQYGSGFEEEE
jgi:hypothetical protein